MQMWIILAPALISLLLKILAQIEDFGSSTNPFHPAELFQASGWQESSSNVA